VSMKLRHRTMPARVGFAREQKGMVLVLSVIVLIAMTLAAYAMMRAVGSSLSVAGNLSFRQNATLAGDTGIEEAIKWVVNNDNVPKRLVRDATVPYYYPTWFAPDGTSTFDPFTFTWDNDTSSAEIKQQGGNTIRYVIHRMCKAAGDLSSSPTQQCVLVPKKYVVEAQGCKPDEDPACGTGNLVYFRVTARVQGPRNTVSYVQVLMF
jgi:type IV pilus assembly protein PilX